MSLINELLKNAPEIGLGTIILIAASIFALGSGVIGFLLGTTCINHNSERENRELRDEVAQLSDGMSTQIAMNTLAHAETIRVRACYTDLVVAMAANECNERRRSEVDLAELGRIIASMAEEIAILRQLHADEAVAHVRTTRAYNDIVVNMGQRLVSGSFNHQADRAQLLRIIGRMSEEMALLKATHVPASMLLNVTRF